MSVRLLMYFLRFRLSCFELPLLFLIYLYVC